MMFNILKISFDQETQEETYESLGFFRSRHEAQSTILNVVKDLIVYKNGKEHLEKIEKIVNEVSPEQLTEKISSSINKGFFYVNENEKTKVFEKTVSNEIDYGWIYNSKIEKGKTNLLYKYVVIECQREENVKMETCHVDYDIRPTCTYMEQLKEILKERRKRIEVEIQKNDFVEC
jgi:hypothetical protein